MAVIFISRATFSGGSLLAEKLAEDLGYECLCREDLLELAAKEGIPVGKLQLAMVKPPRVRRHLAPVRAMYLSFIKSVIADRILEKRNLVYHGHAGHMLLAGIPQMMRVRVLADLEQRIKAVRERLDLPREKAIRYIEDVDRDRDRWAHFLYNVDWNVPLYYDLIVNCEHVHVANLASGLVQFADLPEFKLTPASLHALENLRLASRARYLLAKDRRTSHAAVDVVADHGVIHVRYNPIDAEVAPLVPEVLADLEGCRDVRCAIAQSTIIFVQDQLGKALNLCPRLVHIARQNDASIELMQVVEEETAEAVEAPPAAGEMELLDAGNGGIADDSEEPLEAEDEKALERMQEQLKQMECPASHTTVYGGVEKVVSTLGTRERCSMVIIGELRSGASEAVRTRLREELKSRVTDALGVPAVLAEEFYRRTVVGWRELLLAGLKLIVAAVLAVLVFTHQETVVALFADDTFKVYRWLVVAGLVCFVPFFAFHYGSSTGTLFRWLKMK